MGRPSRLGDEDRSDYASALDEVIASPEIRRLLERSGVPGDRLRVRGLAAVARTAAAADAEYRRYAALRLHAQGGRRDRGPRPLSGPGDQERPGAGVLAVLGVLTPVLAAVAAATFLLLGYGLRLADTLPALADTLVGVGWFSLVVAALAALVSVVALYRTAARQSAAAVPGPSADGSPALAQAREAWLVALRDRGIRPFLLQELAEAEASAPGAGEGRGSRFSSPAFAGPDYSGPGFEGSQRPAPRQPGSGRP
ncbi:MULTISPECIES: hypothetical protein [Streptomyces]|uniref:Transmembrane protein n=1 Tax=Streptomyces rubiginosohelvolus TaxID=67362 RepID=A0ABQ3CCJ3_9ACTN|nr:MULTISPECIES: hypothetical protein [Streptomyces]RUP65757.1 hypothetical protein SSPNP10_23360 [Streptomyces sp. NP10]WST51818.1 hypothetical protein OG475_02650 [Streptomyces rubiginosohelvolus]GGR91090.1 hypothetical protein GCM10010284_25150 [Streptomyces rubiginosohelvolus]GGZ73135.1 hypothetical protein GCM10010328_55290 [Streptomyces pluricolorescens]